MNSPLAQCSLVTVGRSPPPSCGGTTSRGTDSGRVSITQRAEPLGALRVLDVEQKLGWVAAQEVPAPYEHGTWQGAVSETAMV